MKLELKHLAPYYPYGMKVKYQHTIKDFYIIEVEKLGKNYVSDYDSEYDFIDIKPILRPLPDYKNFIIYDQNKDKVEIEFRGSLIQLNDYYKVDLLFKNHFDVFGLIKKGLAIDINTL